MVEESITELVQTKEVCSVASVGCVSELMAGVGEESLPAGWCRFRKMRSVRHPQHVGTYNCELCCRCTCPVATNLTHFILHRIISDLEV